MVKITKRSVEAAARTGKEYFLWDDELRGFGLRVHPSGRKIYLAQFRAGGRIRRVNIGPHGPITPDQARTEAMKHLSDVRLGSDPGAQRDRLRAAATMKAFGKRFLDEHVASHCKPSTQYEYRRCVDLFITPKLGTLKVIDVTRADVVELHQGLKETPYQANRVLGVLSIMFTLADTWGVRTDGINPCWKVKRYKEVKRERYLTPDEFARLGKVLREADGEPEAGSRNLHPAAAPDRVPSGGNTDPEMGLCGRPSGRPALAGFQDRGQGRAHRQGCAGRAGGHSPDRRQSLCHHRQGGGAISDRHPETVATDTHAGWVEYPTYPRSASLLRLGCTPAGCGPDHDRAVIGPHAGADHRALCAS